jgi:hypothetical protein
VSLAWQWRCHDQANPRNLETFSHNHKEVPASAPLAGASIRYALAGGKPRIIKASSAMLPVKRAAFYSSQFDTYDSLSLLIILYAL